MLDGYSVSELMSVFSWYFDLTDIKAKFCSLLLEGNLDKGFDQREGGLHWGRCFTRGKTTC